METIKTMQPGEAGTHHLLRKYGDRLVCVRYRKDRQLKKRYTTVELIIAERPDEQKTTPVIRVLVNIRYGETALRAQVKLAGGRWLADEKLWEIDIRDARRLGLEKRIVKRLVKPGV